MCTAIGFKNKSGIVFGRTLELAHELKNEIIFIPKGQFFGINGEKFLAKYDILGTSFFKMEALGDGFNSEGLCASANFFPNYAQFNNDFLEDKHNIISGNYLGYILANCKDIDEVIEYTKKINLVDKKNEELSNPLHFMFMDKSGRCIVVEPLDKEIIINENPLGTMTNSPDFNWHLTNVRNFLNLHENTINNKLINGFNFEKIGLGNSMLGLPGDFSPSSRFIRASYFVSKTPKNLDDIESINQGFRILSSFDIPFGSVLDNDNYEKTLYTSIINTNLKTYYLKTYDNIIIKKFDMKDFDSIDKITFIELK